LADERKRVARKLLLLPAMAWVLLAAVGYIPTRSLAGADGVQAMWLAQSLVAAVVMTTLLLAMRRMVGKAPLERFKLAMLAGAVRFLATAGLLTAVAWRGEVHVAVFLLWGAGTYLVMAILEAVALARWFRYLESEKRC
jgi:uncharacterized membrane protein